MARVEKEISKTKLEVIESFVAEMQTDSTIEVLKKMKEIMNKSFGEENNQISPLDANSIIEYYTNIGYGADFIHNMTDLQFKQQIIRDYHGYNVIIRFPEITITNSRKMSHVIRDLYVKFAVGKDGLFRGHINGTRATLTEDEYQAAYLHSHLTSLSPGNIRFSPFCTGEGQINQVIALLGRKFDEVNFTLFCLHLKNYVAWESLEGHPYMHIEYIGIGNRSSTNNILHQTVRDKIKNVLKNAIFTLKVVDFEKMFITSISPNCITISSTEDFEKWAAAFLDKIDWPANIDRYTDISRIVGYMDSDGTYFPVFNSDRRLSRIEEQKKPVLKFKGEDKFLTIIKQKNEIKATKYLDPAITQELCRELSSSFTKIAINLEGVEEQKNISDSIPEAAKSDSVFV